MNVGGVILAAGASTRLGKPKQLAILDGERLLDRAVRLCQEAGCTPLVVVLGAYADDILAGCRLSGAHVLLCERWAEGMSRSLVAGIEWMMQPAIEGAVVMTADMPFVSAQHLRTLSHEPDVLRASGYDGRRGVPAYFPRGFFGELMKLAGDAGARDLLREAAVEELGLEALDVDTLEDLNAARRRASQSP